MSNRRTRTYVLMAAAALLGGCEDQQTGPLRVSAIGPPPELVNPNLVPLAPPTAFLLEGVAQGLVRFNAAGEVEPALAQSWIVSDDGLRYTFRLRRAEWADGRRITAEQVAARLRAALSPASRNPLKPVLSVVDDVVAMTDEVLELSLSAPRPHLLQLLAQPEMSILRNGVGTGPYWVDGTADGALRLVVPVDEEEGEALDLPPPILLRGEPAASAVARFVMGGSDLVLGGTAGGLPVARAADLPSGALVLDPAAGLFGFAFVHRDGPFANPEFRRALDMAVDRAALVSAIGAPGLQPQASIAPSGLEDLPAPAQPDWADQPMPMRRAQAQAVLDGLPEPVPVIRVAISSEPGHRQLFAHLRRDWRAIGLEVERVEPGAPADLVLVDEIAPAPLPSWYLRNFTCRASAICSAAADEALATASRAGSLAERQAALAQADQAILEVNPFIALTSPVRWSLVSPRISGFRPNPFSIHGPSELIAERR